MSPNKNTAKPKTIENKIIQLSSSDTDKQTSANLTIAGKTIDKKNDNLIDKAVRLSKELLLIYFLFIFYYLKFFKMQFFQ